MFKSDDSFRPFKPLYNGKPSNIAGYFQPGEDENIIALNVKSKNSEQYPMALIYHEYTHMLTSQTPRDWPLWSKEGLAELYSSFDVDRNKVTLGAPIASHVYLLRESKFMPLQDLFGVDHSSPSYNERDKQGVFYAESWALVHYLMFGDNSARQPQMRFSESDTASLDFYSQDSQFDGSIGCGPVNRSAFIYFKPIPGGQSRLAGYALAVEFTK